MTDRPILFTDAMVRAMLRGEKTRSRRPASSFLALSRPKDRLWVREALVRDEALKELRYRADDARVASAIIPSQFSDSRKQIPSIHMPRWASRLTLIVTAVTHERLQDVNHKEAMREGVEEWAKTQDLPTHLVENHRPEALFAALWDSLYGRTSNRWAENPLVAVVKFSVHERPIDTVPGR